MAKRRVTLVHLDLGIGGAERLVVNVSLALLSSGHDVTIVTTHHDLAHCFEETRGEGPLAGRIRVVGSWLPRQLMGYGTALCSHVCMMYATAWCIFRHKELFPDVIFMDGVSTPLPLLLWARIPTIFYCHYPDLLLCSSSSRSLLRRLYRLVLDTAEEWTTACATTILVNSLFTKETFRRTFPGLTATDLQVLYPTLEDCVQSSPSILPEYFGAQSGTKQTNLFVSLNRYERKKRIELALHALDFLKKNSGDAPRCRPLLVIAGGYDERVVENVQYLRELQSVADGLGLKWQFPVGNVCETLRDDVDVAFRISISGKERDSLLEHASALLYTPENEHFGIVPLEAMRAGTPVIAVNNGGPVETIVHETTGFLCEQNPSSFATAMALLMGKPESASDGGIIRSAESMKMGLAGKAHVSKHFTAKAMREGLEVCIAASLALPTTKRQRDFGARCFWSFIALLASSLTALVFASLIALRFKNL